jgi:hypothetical protein
MEEELKTPRLEDLDAVAQWWYKTGQTDAERYMRKRKEYGSADLRIMGGAMLELVPNLNSQAEGIEMALMFYALGKVARAFGAYAAGRLPSDDTMEDLAIYGMMARMLREGHL